MSLIDELQRRVKLLNDERDCLRHRKDSLHGEIVLIDVRMNELNDTFRRHGLISKAKQRLAQAELERDDECRSEAVFLNAGNAPKDKFVVHKITPNRIFIRRKGHSSSMEQFHHDGRSVRRHGAALDLKATFGDDYETLLKNCHEQVH